jgi:hypothetical protein
MTCHGYRRSSVVRSVDSATTLGLGCVGGVVLALLRQMIGRWFLALVNRK